MILEYSTISYLSQSFMNKKPTKKNFYIFWSESLFCMERRFMNCILTGRWNWKTRESSFDWIKNIFLLKRELFPINKIQRNRMSECSLEIPRLHMQDSKRDTATFRISIFAESLYSNCNYFLRKPGKDLIPRPLFLTKIRNIIQSHLVT